MWKFLVLPSKQYSYQGKNEFSCASLVEINILYMGGLGGEAPQEKIAILDNIISKFC